MAKNIKKSLKYFIIIAGVIIMLPTVLYPVLQISSVQTFLVKRITNHLSNQIKSTLSIGRIEYIFFNKLSINDILIKDKNNDTLIYSKKVSLRIKDFNLKNNTIKLGRVILIKPVVALITDSTGLMNLTWYLDLLKNPKDSTKTNSIIFSVDQIDISNARFSLIKHNGPAAKTKIDFNNLNMTGINGIIEDLKIRNDTTSFNVYNLGFKELSGFSVNRMNSSVMLAKQNILLKSTSLNCDSSMIHISRLEILADSSGSFKRFSEEVRLNILLEKSFFSTSDFRYFIPSASSINESVWLSGKISGTVSELRGRNIKLSYRENTYLDCNFDLSGLPKIENAFIYIGVNSLKTNAKDIERIKIPGKGNIIVPEVLYKLGNISFDGSFTGFTTDFVTYGKIRTNFGNISTDISLRPEESNKYRIKGLLTGSDIDLGELTGKTEFLGKVSMQTNVDGYATSFNKFAANLTGRIDSIEVNKYVYRNITLKGFFTEKTWDGSINIVDKNIKLDLLGLLNFNEKLPEFDFTLNIAKARLYELNFDKIDTSSSLSMLITSNFKGSNIDNLDGEIKLLNSNFRKYSKDLELYNFSIRTYKESNKPVLSLRTDFLDADIRGYYNFATIGNLFKSTFATLMPSQFPAKSQRNELKKNKFNFEINFKNTDKINSFFRTGLLLADKSYIRGIISPDSVLSITGKAKTLSFRNNIFHDFSLDALVSGSELSADIKSSSLLLLKQSELKDFSIKLMTKPDNFIFTVDWDNLDKNLNKGNFIARGIVTKNAGGKRNSILTISIDSTDVYARNNLWKLSHSTIMVDSTSIMINKLYIGNKDRYYLVNGSVSADPADTLHLEFKAIDISPLNFLINQNKDSDPGAIRPDFKGTLNGKILLTNVYKNLLLEGNIFVNNFSLLGSDFGNISIISALDINKKIVNIKASNNLAGAKTIDISGYYDPAFKKLDLAAKASKLPIDALNPLLKVFASGISGFATGKVNLTSEPGSIVLRGAVMAENTSMKINYLQTKYKMNDTVRFDKNGIRFNNIRITDEKGNTANLSGTVNHKNFHDFNANLVINTKECMVLNTKPKDNALFYGTAYASGVTTIKSGANSLSFDISAKTGKNTKFFIPLSNDLSISEYSFITFVDSKTGKEKVGGADSILRAFSPPKQTGMDLNFNLEVTPDAEVQLIFDSKAGDVMKGHGSSENLNINLNKKGEFRITGDYFIEDGDYLFTLGNILNKSFSVENGGKITFNGDINNAEIDIKAKYKLKASLYEILKDERFKERIPVECQLNLTGKLFNPIVGFNIYLPTADEQTRSYLQNAISTEEELSRQFVYLLMMNSFYSDPSTYGSSSVSTTTAGTSAMAVTTTEMISNQLSNWISQISNDFDLGFVYRPGSSSLNPQEVEVALSTQLLNDKVIINGNFDVRGTGKATNNTDQITGDFDAEVKITEKIRFKVFNRFNDITTGKGPYTQGVGIFFKQDFDNLSDLFRKKVKSDMKKEDETTPKDK
jgi:hypothetical protein